MNLKWYEKAIVAIPKIVKVINIVTDTLITILRAVIISFAIPILCLALFVEQQRISHGISLFEENSMIASLGAWLLVLANLIFEIAINYIEQRAGWKLTPPAIFSIRSFMNKIAYWIGFSPTRGEQWKEKLQSPAHQWKSVLSLITKTILFLAIIGSLKDEFMNYKDVPWFEGLAKILFESDIETLGVILSGFLFAMAIVKISQELTHYITIRAVEFSYELEGIVNEVDPERIEEITQNIQNEQDRILEVYAEFIRVTPENVKHPVAMDSIIFDEFKYWDPKYKSYQNGSHNLEELEASLRRKIKARS